jgi:uncharacterized membrane protein YphA (DoxX/SURF4 family)
MPASTGKHTTAAAVALRVMALGIGIFFVAMGAQKIEWLFDSGPLMQRFERWIPTASSTALWYLDTLAIPGVEVFARLVPIAEIGAGVALIVGLLTRVTATLALIMVINFHLATSAFFSQDILQDGTGPPLLAGLLALAIGAKDLPLSIRARRRRTSPLLQSDVPVLDLHRRAYMHLHADEPVGRTIGRVIVDDDRHDAAIDRMR